MSILIYDKETKNEGLKSFVTANDEANDIPGYKVQKTFKACATCEFYNYNEKICDNKQNEADAIKLMKKID